MMTNSRLLVQERLSAPWPIIVVTEDGRISVVYSHDELRWATGSQSPLGYSNAQLRRRARLGPVIGQQQRHSPPPMHSPREFSPAVQRGLYWAARGWSWALCLEFLRHPGSPQASISSVPCFSALCFLTCSCICSHGGWRGRAGRKIGSSPRL